MPPFDGLGGHGDLRDGGEIGKWDIFYYVYGIMCFFVHRAHRGKGVAQALLEAAVQFAAEHSAQAVEGYPIKAEAGHVGDWAAYTGTYDMFIEAGFRELAVTDSVSGGKRRVVMRWDVKA